MSKQSVLLGVLTVAAATGWFYRDDIRKQWEGETPPAVQTVIGGDHPREELSGPAKPRGDAAKKIYSWRDAEGNVHFDSHDDVHDASEVRLSKGNTVSLNSARDKTAPPPAPVTHHGNGGGEPPVPLQHQVEKRLNSPAAQQQAEMNAVSEGMR